MSFSARHHPELGHDATRGQWYIGAGTWHVRTQLTAAGAVYDKPSERWYFDATQGGEDIARTCAELNEWVRENVWKKPHSKAGQKRLAARGEAWTEEAVATARDADASRKAAKEARRDAKRSRSYSP